MPDGANVTPGIGAPAQASGHDAAGSRAPTHAFAQLGATGRGGWWRYLLSIVTMVLLYVLFFVALTAVVGFAMSDGTAALQSVGERFGTVKDWSSVSFGEAATTFAALTIPIILLLPAVLLAVSWVHRRPAKTLLTARRRFDWGAVALSFGAIVALEGLAQIIGYLVFPGHYHLVFDATRFLWFAPLVLLLVPLQVLSEEVLFRGYMVQIIGRFTGNRAVLVALPGLIFAALHLGNPEVGYGGGWAIATYVLVALYLTWLVIRGDGLEYAFGLHLGINLFVFSIMGSTASPYPAPTIFFVDTINYAAGLPIMIAIFGIHYWVLFGRRRALPA